MGFPVVFEVWGAEIRAHKLFELAGYALGFQTYLFLKRRTGDVVGLYERWSALAAAAVGAALGSKLLYLLDDPALTWSRRGDIEFLVGGKTIVGGLLGGWAAVEIVKRIQGARRRTGDLFAAPIFAGIAIGRLGCFCEGLGDRTYGLPSSLSFAVDFGDGTPRHPTQIYEALFAAILFVPLVRATLRRPKGWAEGDVFRAAMAAYLAWRLAIDFLKPRATWWAGLSGIQAACVAGVLWIAFDRWRRGRGVRTSRS